MNLHGHYPTYTGIIAYCLGVYFFLYFEFQAWLHWREEQVTTEDKRVPQRKWISCALGLVCSMVALPALIMNGEIPPSAYDFWRGVLVLLCILLWISISRVEGREKRRGNRRLTVRELEQWRTQNKEYLRQQAEKLQGKR